MKCLLEIAVDLVQALVDDRPFALQDRLEATRRAISNAELGPSSKAILNAAAARNIPSIRLNDQSLVQLGYGKQRRFIETALTSKTSAVGVDIASDKDLTKALLARAEIPTPRGRVVVSEDEAVRAVAGLGSPVVVKPLDANQGKGVTLNVIRPEDVAQAFRNATRYSRHVIVEEFFTGCDYRILVVGGKMVAASRREPARLTADGKSTIRELIDELNRDPMRSTGHGSALSHVEIDDVVHHTLRKQGFTLDSVVTSGIRISLRENANLSTGGNAVDVTDEVHPDFRRMCERAARTVELDICGVDLVVPDISTPFESGGIVEVNAAPGLRMHVHPSEGKPRDVGAAIIEMMYPNGADGRIPIIAITGTNGKTTTARLTAHILGEGGATVGLTTTDGICIGGEQIVSGDTTGPRSARVVLSDPSVEYAVLETARGGIVRTGLGYDWSDVAVITNISPDHIGQDGIRSIDDLIRIKALIAERVKPGGVLVLNADDPSASEVLKRPKLDRASKRIVWFSMESSTPLLNDHRTMGGTAYFPRDGWLIEAEGIVERRIVELASVPLTFGGTAAFQIANVLAAVAAARAVECEIEQVRCGVQTFGAAKNPGRANLYQAPNGYVLFDYGHNTAALAATAAMVNDWGAARLTAILSIPGDRATALIEDAARVAARGFDRVVLREEKDLRGRNSGEVSGILFDAIMQEDPECEVSFVADEGTAVLKVIETMSPGEVAVVFSETSHGWDILASECRCSPVASPDIAFLTELQRTANPSRARIA
jgi:cyanophycin synthetase